MYMCQIKKLGWYQDEKIEYRPAPHAIPPKSLRNPPGMNLNSYPLGDSNLNKDNTMRTKLLTVILFMAVGALAFGQSAEEMDALLADEVVSFARAARYVLPAAEILSEDISEEEAFRAAQERGWVPLSAAPDDSIRLDQFSYLVMKSFSLKGGVCYSIFPGRRYAYRELLSRNYVQGRSDPSQALSGSRLVLILGHALDDREVGL